MKFPRSIDFQAHTSKPKPVAAIKRPKVQSNEGHVASQRQEQPMRQQTRPSRATHEVNPSGLQGLVDPSMETDTTNLYQNSPAGRGTARQGFPERAKKRNNARDARNFTSNKDSPYVQG